MIDISLGTMSHRLCNGTSRRDFLRVGGLGLFGLSLAGALAGEKAFAADATGVKRRPRAKSIVLVYLGGGMSHHDTFDPKPAMPTEIRGKYKAISTNVSGMMVGELLPKMAKIMDKVSVVRSGVHNNISHEVASNWVLSGRFGSPFGDYPAMGAVVAHEMGFSGTIPPYVSIPSNPAFSWELGKSAFLGGRYEAFKAGDPNETAYKVPDLGLRQPLSERAVERRKTLLAAVDHLGAQVRGNDQMATYDEFQQKAAEMLLSPHAQSAFAIEQESTGQRDAYGHHTFGQSCLLARRLIERDARFVTVSFTGWDHHKNIFTSLDKKLPMLDQGLSSLITDMDERGLLKDTLLVMLTDFGRSPKVNKDAGRDHWGDAASMIFAGAGVRGGNIVGATDKEGASVTDRPVRPADVAHTVYSAVGIDPRKELRTPEGRPIAILNEGGLIEELYS